MSLIKENKIKEGLKVVGGCLLYIIVSFGFLFIFWMIVMGGIRTADKIMPILNYLALISFFISLVILCPLAFFKKTRGIAGIGMFIASYAFGIDLWMYSVLVVYSTWGLLALIISLLFLGVGAVPIAILATLFNGMWSIFGELLVMAILTYGTRLLGFYLVEKYEHGDTENIASESMLLNAEGVPDATDAEFEDIIDGEIIDANKKYCTSCGKETSSAGNFCKYCGNKLI